MIAISGLLRNHFPLQCFLEPRHDWKIFAGADHPWGWLGWSLKAQAPIGARTADREICRQLRSANSAYNSSIFSARFARTLSVYIRFFICFTALVCLYCLSKKSCSTKIAKIKLILQIYVGGALSLSSFRVRRDHDLLFGSEYLGKLPSLPPKQKSPLRLCEDSANGRERRKKMKKKEKKKDRGRKRCI